MFALYCAAYVGCDLIGSPAAGLVCTMEPFIIHTANTMLMLHVRLNLKYILSRRRLISGV